MTAAVGETKSSGPKRSEEYQRRSLQADLGQTGDKRERHFENHVSLPRPQLRLKASTREPSTRTRE
jgi:hypothetical protein